MTDRVRAIRVSCFVCLWMFVCVVVYTEIYVQSCMYVGMYVYMWMRNFTLYPVTDAKIFKQIKVTYTMNSKLQ